MKVNCVSDTALLEYAGVRARECLLRVMAFAMVVIQLHNRQITLRKLRPLQALNKSPNLASSFPTRNITGVPISFQLRVFARRLMPLPLEISRDFFFAFGALNTMG